MTLLIKQAGLDEYLSGSEKIKVLLVGPPGAGKTRLLGFAPRPLIADCDGGILSVADLKTPYARIKSEEDMNGFLELLKGEARKPTEQRRFETVGVDTLDRYQRIVIQGYLKRTRRKEMDGWEDWGYLDGAMNHLISTLMDLPFHVVVTAHIKEVKIGQGQTQRSQLALDLQGSQRERLPGDFDFVGLLTNEFEATTDPNTSRIKRVIQWEATPNADFLKARGGGLFSTVATFDAAGFDAIKDGIRAQIASQQIVAGEVIESIETVPITEGESNVAPTPPQPGGPVSTGLSRGRKPAVPTGQGTLPAAAAAPAVPADRPLAVTPPPPAKRPESPAEQAAQMANGVAVVQEVLGGKVIEDTAAEDHEIAEVNGVAEEVVKETKEDVVEEPTTDVVAEEPAAAPDVTPDVTPVAVNNPWPTDGEWTTTCGSPRYEGHTPVSGVGCGQPITVQLEHGRIVGAENNETTQIPNLIDIGVIKFRAVLHNACFHKARQATATATAAT